MAVPLLAVVEMAWAADSPGLCPAYEPFLYVMDVTSVGRAMG